MRTPPTKNSALTLLEMLVVVAVLTSLVVLLAQVIGSTTSVTTLCQRRMEADTQARPLFERMALDFAQMIKRPDVSYYLKSAETPMPGNDLLAFYSASQGYFPTSPSPITVVAYRVNAGLAGIAALNSLERMARGLDWNGASTATAPMVFLPLTIQGTWPSTTSNSTYDDSNPARRTYEIIGPQVFRFEYYYVERETGNLVPYPTAWNSLAAVSIGDAVAIVTAIAVMDPQGSALLSSSQISMLGEMLPDYSRGWGPGELLAQWQSMLDGITNVPRTTLSHVHLYERCFYLFDR